MVAGALSAVHTVEVGSLVAVVDVALCRGC